MLIFGMLFFSIYGQTMAEIVTLPKNGSIPTATKGLKATEKGILIDVKDMALKDLLQWIQNESDICFSLSSGLLKVPITISLEEPNWNAAVRRLIRSFSKMEVWFGDKCQHHVLLVESGTSMKDLSVQKKGFISSNKTRKPEEPVTVARDSDKAGKSNSGPNPRVGRPPPTDDQGMGGGSPPPDDYEYPENAGPDASNTIEEGSPPPDDYEYPENAGGPPPVEESQ
jgi:hypothetical protein